jgi:UDP-N-acetylmuramate dehydrogenase
MQTASIVDELKSVVRGIIKTDEPMGRHTTIGVGGPADIYIEPNDEEDLSKILAWTYEREVPLFVLGDGANLLVSDKGIRGVVVRMGRPFSYIKVDGELVIAGAGAKLAKVIDAAVKEGLAGLEVATAIPGTVGGALVMNAGTHLGDIGPAVESVRALKRDGSLWVMSRGDMHFSYRHSVLQDDKSLFVTQATFHLCPGNKQDLVRTVESLRHRRTTTQPTIGRSAGCMFKNPEGDKAGRMIDELGFKGKMRGDAMVSDRHANFVMNMGNATASDIRGLAEEVRQAVKDRYGVELEYEVRVVGDW